MVKIEMTSYGATFNLHCPRCGCAEWSDEIYKIAPETIYRKCLHCGADVRTDNQTNITIVVEDRFMTFDELTYQRIERELSGSGWEKGGA